MFKQQPGKGDIVIRRQLDAQPAYSVGILGTDQPHVDFDTYEAALDHMMKVAFFLEIDVWYSPGNDVTFEALLRHDKRLAPQERSGPETFQSRQAVP